MRNTSLPKSHALLPLLEAVVNAIQAVDVRFPDDVSQGLVDIRIHRSDQGEFDLGPGRPALKPITGFTVDDNGVGFTPDNMTSFETLDSDYKAGIGCRGVGRLLWLKAFDRVTVRSAYVDQNGELQARHFRFSEKSEVEHLEYQEPARSEPGAEVYLDGFKEAYQQNAAKTVDAIAREVFEHCVWYFLRPGGAPEVRVIDDDGAAWLADLLTDSGFLPMEPATVEVQGRKFSMMNLRLRYSARNPAPRLYWCAASRVVMDENLTGKVTGLYGKLRDRDSSEFTFVSYLSSDYLDEHVRADRTAFDIPDRVPGDGMSSDIALDDIRAVVLKKIEELLADALAVARAEGKARVNDFVSNHAPRYRPVLARLVELGLTVDPSTKDQDLELVLHRGLQKLEAEALTEGQEVFAQAGFLPPEEYQARLDAHLAKITEINQSDLAAYVGRRRTILDFLSQVIRTNGTGKYALEEAVHALLMPMRTTSNDIGTEASNLWIIDERLAFHDYLASDKTLTSMPITGSDSTKEPDILSTRLVGTPVLAAEGDKLPLASIVVIEIKRPMRDDVKEDRDPIEQCLDYVSRVREGGVKTASGRPIPRTDDPPAFCYILADLTPSMVKRCKYMSLNVTHDGLGYFGYNVPHRAYIEVISFDRLLSAATERNRAFFDKLGLPSS